VARAPDQLPEGEEALKAALIETRARLSGAQALSKDSYNATTRWRCCLREDGFLVYQRRPPGSAGEAA
jgi:hypothetical protein